MPPEAKLGLIAGVGVVLAVALVFFKPAAKPASAAPTKMPAAQRASLSPMLPARAEEQSFTFRVRAVIPTLISIRALPTSSL